MCPSEAEEGVSAAGVQLEPLSTEELIDRARRSYLRALGSGRRNVPAELASTLALVPLLCRQLELLHSEAGSPRAESDHAAARTSDDDRDRLLRVLEHELRNRLNSPRLYLRLLEEALSKLETGDEPRRLSELLSTGIESAASVVDDISCLLAPPRERQIPLRTLVLELVGQQAARAAEQGVALEVVEPLSSASFQRHGLRLVFENLVLNALEHHAGGPDAWVRVSTRRRGDEVVLRVEDNGPGLSKRARDRLLGKESAAPNGRRDAGLGLVVVARAIESLGARLELETGAGRGTRVAVHLRMEG